VIRVAAVGDLHLAPDSLAAWQQALGGVADEADLLLLAGDLTRSGAADEAEALGRLLRGMRIPTLAVLGNHDFDADRPESVAKALEENGASCLEGRSGIVEVRGVHVGVAGSKGFGGGFEGACGSEFGEPEMKAFLRHTRSLAQGLEKALTDLDADLRIALLHYAPVPDTLAGERLEIYPFLGSYLLGEAVDRAGADLVLHGHAHAGREKGVTPAGIRVRNVAQPVIGHAYHVYCFPEEDAR
jgi:Icc-related predicted phosphoesterase